MSTSGPITARQGCTLAFAQSTAAEEADHYNIEVEDWHTYFVAETERDFVSASAATAGSRSMA